MVQQPRKQWILFHHCENLTSSWMRVRHWRDKGSQLSAWWSTANGPLSSQLWCLLMLQNGMYTTTGLPPQQPNLASNPFFNMGATAVGNTAATTTGFPPMSQVCCVQHVFSIKLVIWGICEVHLISHRCTQSSENYHGGWTPSMKLSMNVMPLDATPHLYCLIWYH